MKLLSVSPNFSLTGITNSAIFVKLRSYKKKGAFLMQMNVSVTPELYELVQRMVQSGLYGNASEVVRDALRRMDERTIVDSAWSKLNDKLGASAASGRSPYSVSEVISRQTTGMTIYFYRLVESGIEVLRFLHCRSDIINKLSAYL